jgi:cytochrome c oxidase cbb3-type subunit II
MKNGLLIFAGAFATMAFSLTAVVLTAHNQLGSLTQYKDPVEETLYPRPRTGLANQGRQVYQDLGCATCHTQQVRRAGLGADAGEKSRNWGARQSVARDYIQESTVLIGSRRLGPDLRNVGARQPDAAHLYKLLYSPESKFAGEYLAHGMPAYPFLFVSRPVGQAQPSHQAVMVTEDGREIIPTARAQALVAYLLSLNDTYEYPEAKPFVSAAKEGGH